MIKLNYSYTILFASTVAGVGTAADSTPTAVLWRNGSASGVSVTVSTTAQTGLYKAVFTTDSGWANGDFLELYATATIAGTAGYLAKVWSSTEIGAAELDSASLRAALGMSAADLDTQLDNIVSVVQGSEVIQVASPNVSGNLVLTQGDDYDGVANPKATWTVTTDYTTGWTVSLTIRDVDDAVVYTTTGTVASATSVQVTIAAPTGLTMTGCPGQWQGKFDVELTHSSGKKKTIALGVCYINEDQTR